MTGTILLLVFAIPVAILSLIVLIYGEKILKVRQSRATTLIFMMVVSALILLTGIDNDLEKSKKTEFCLSCHVMQPYGKSLNIDDEEAIPAVHYQNKYVSRDRACYTCHTEYTMYGGLKAKLGGIRHFFVYYFGIPPAKLKLRNEYKNRECLSCHGGGRKFEEVRYHRKGKNTLNKIYQGKLSCLAGGCHDFVHEVEDLGEMNFWKDTTEWKKEKERGKK